MQISSSSRLDLSAEKIPARSVYDIRTAIYCRTHHCWHLPLDQSISIDIRQPSTTTSFLLGTLSPEIIPLTNVSIYSHRLLDFTLFRRICFAFDSLPSTELVSDSDDFLWCSHGGYTPRYLVPMSVEGIPGLVVCNPSLPFMRLPITRLGFSRSSFLPLLDLRYVDKSSD